MDWLDKIYDNCVESDIRFNKRLLYSFHTALKTADWSPLTVLAGVSGTGKSILPEYYARYGGLYFMSMAVQPDWDSPQALFGYFNSVDNRFNATTLLRAMVQFSNKPAEIVKDSNLSDTMFLVLLDEMNLAHVELYFSDMLSKLERRRNTNDDICVEIDLGAGMDKYQLELNDNVLWVGTMNEDETTKSLSDKVLDRGNLISFPRPKEFMSRKKIHNNEPAPMLSKTTWNEWLEDTAIENPNFIELIKKYKKGLEEVNEAMGSAGRALGHRVWQSIENYMANHPLVIEAFKKTPDDKIQCDKALVGAFEEALVHKVMPKLRGIETDGSVKTQCIDRIENVLFGNAGIANGLYADFESAVNNTYETFLWSSAAYLEEE
jgi:5-methylcytosine-specific restriction endonuclease McrBC GTP-binding regulatory subunit McrB